MLRFALALLFLCSSLAWGEPSSTAFLEWILHSDSHVVLAGNRMRRLVHESPDVFGKIDGRDTTLAREATLAEFEAAVGKSLENVKGQANPSFVFSLGSHGGRNEVCRDRGCGTYELKEIYSALKRQIAAHPAADGKPIPVTFIYDACHSGSLQEVIQKELTGQERQRFPVTVIAASPAGLLAHGSELVTAMGSAVNHFRRSNRPEPSPFSPVERVARLTSTFITSTYDHPTSWSSVHPLERWTGNELRQELKDMPRPFVLSGHVIAALDAELTPTVPLRPGTESFREFATRMGGFTYLNAVAGIILDSTPTVELRAQIEDLIFDGSLPRETASLVALWAESLPASTLEKNIVGTWENQRLTGTALQQYRDAKALNKLQFLKQEGFPERPGPFGTFAAYLKKMDVPSAGHAELIHSIDSARTGELSGRLETAVRKPDIPIAMIQHLAIWAESLPESALAKETIDQWDALALKRDPHKAEAYWYQRMSLKSKALAELKDATGLFALYGTVPKYSSDRRRSFASLAVQTAFLNLVVNQRLETPENMAAISDLVADRQEISHAAASFWSHSPHAKLSPHMITRFFDDYGLEHLEQRFRNEPESMKLLIETVAGLDRGEDGKVKKRRLFDLVKLRGTPATCQLANALI